MKLGGLNLRIVQFLFWSLVCFVIAPSKVAGIAYALVLGFLMITIILSLGVTSWIIKAVRRLLR